MLRRAMRSSCLALAAAALVAGPAAAQESCVQMPPGTVSWWPADGTMEDLVGGHDAQDLGWGHSVQFASGRVGQAFDLSGFDAALRVSSHPDLDFDSTDEYSIVLWLLSPEASSSIGQQALVSKWDGSAVLNLP